MDGLASPRVEEDSPRENDEHGLADITESSALRDGAIVRPWYVSATHNYLHG